MAVVSGRPTRLQPARASPVVRTDLTGGGSCRQAQLRLALSFVFFQQPDDGLHTVKKIGVTTIDCTQQRMDGGLRGGSDPALLGAIRAALVFETPRLAFEHG